MDRLSLVTARVVRQNEQYNYKVVGKGEQYLVKHADDERADEKAIEFLKPFSREPVIVVRTELLKGSVELLEHEEADRFYKCITEYMELLETGKEKKVTGQYFVQASNISEVMSQLLKAYMHLDAVDVKSIARSKIIDVIK